MNSRGRFLRLPAAWGIRAAGWWAVTMAAIVPAWAAERSDHGTADALTLQFHWQPQAQFAGYLMAKEKGFFRAEGLGEVTIQWSAAGQRPLALLAERKVDFCTAWLCEALAQRAQGRRVVLLAQVIERSTMTFVARRRPDDTTPGGKNIVTPADMTGRRVGLWGGDFDVPPKAFFKKYNVEPVIVPQSTSMVPFLRGAVDVASAMHYNEYHKLLEAGLRPEDLQVFHLSQYGMDFPEDGLYCHEDLRRQQPDRCAAMVKAVTRGWQYASGHEAETLDAVMDYCGREHVRTSRNHQRWMLRSILEAMGPRPGDSPESCGRLKAEIYRSVAEELVRQKVIDRAPPFESFYVPPQP
jgi:NitT/TauT family transport system substrate-binding protein